MTVDIILHPRPYIHTSRNKDTNMEDDIGYEWWWYGILQLIHVIKKQVTWISGKLSEHSCCVALFSILCIFLWAMFRWFPTSIIGKIKLVGAFFLFNSVLPGADMVTDILNVNDLYQKSNPAWATISLFWVFVPFLLKLSSLFVKVYRQCKSDLEPQKKGFKHALAHTLIFFPFFLPLLNTILSIKLTMIKVADSANGNQIEKIKKIAALASLYESFFESGPQLLTQIHIVLCTGEISNIQIFSMAVSFFTLTLAACKAFYVQRDFDQADPDPSLPMVLRVFPYMAVVIINSTLQWTIITGLSKGFVFLAIPLVFCSTFIYLKRKEIGIPDEREEEVPQIKIDPGNVTKEDDKHQEEKNDKTYFIDLLVSMAEVPELDENYFSLKAAMTSLWVPCVVGKKDQQTFNKSAYSSLIFKTLILIISIILAFTGSYPHYVQKGTFLLHCFDKQIVNQLAINSTFEICNENLIECFKKNNTALVQILHICDEDDEIVKGVQLGFVITFFGLALLATYCLNN